MPAVNTIAILLNNVSLEIFTLYAWAKNIITRATTPQPANCNIQYNLFLFISGVNIIPAKLAPLPGYLYLL